MEQCCSSKVYSPEYDAYYCKFCNVWLENKCSNEDCEFCSQRPEFPLSVEE